MGFNYKIENNEVIITGYNGKHGKSIEIPEFIEGSPVTKLFYWCFDEQSSIEEIIIPNSVKYINIGAFYKCTSLKQITIPNSVKYIAKDAFNGCISLTNINIPNSVDYIGESAFFRCRYLKTINNIELKTGNNIINNRFLYDSGWVYKIKYQILDDYSCDSDIKSINGKLYCEDFRYL